MAHHPHRPGQHRLTKHTSLGLKKECAGASRYPTRSDSRARTRTRSRKLNPLRDTFLNRLAGIAVFTQDEAVKVECAELPPLRFWILPKTQHSWPRNLRGYGSRTDDALPHDCSRRVRSNSQCVPRIGDLNATIYKTTVQQCVGFYRGKTNQNVAKIRSRVGGGDSSPRI